METEVNTKCQQSGQPPIFMLVEGDDFSRHLQELSEAIAHRAYELFEGEGYRDGHDLEDWYRAESQLLQPVPVEFEETDHSLTVRADIPGFTDREVEVRVGTFSSSAARRNIFLTTEAETFDQLRSAAVSIWQPK